VEPVILEKIRQAYPQLTKSQKKLASFIANSYQEAAFMTASRMARHLGLNEATVIRFAQRLGYSGYPGLIRDVQSVVQDEFRARGEAEAGVAEEEPFLTSLSSELESLSRTASHVSPRTARHLVAIVRGARRIVVCGQGASYHLAGLLAASLAGLGHDTRLVPGDPEALALALVSLEAADVFVGVAVTEESPEVAQAIGVARERGARTLAISRSPVSRSAQAAELVLACPASSAFAVPPVAMAAILVDALVQAVSTYDHEGARHFAQQAEDAARRVRSA